MKISLADLKKTLAWIEANTMAEFIVLKDHTNSLSIETVDKYGKLVEIEIYKDSNLMPKIRKTETL